MSELDNIVAVYRAIDEIAMEDPEAVERIRTVVAPYRTEGRSGWTQTEAGQRLVDGVPPLEEALADMAATEPRGRLRSRRLLALAALIRADLGRFGRNGTDVELVADALVPLMPPDGPGVGDLGDRVPQLVTLLEGTAGESIFGDLESWRAMLEQALELNLLDARTTEQTTPPCSADVIMVQVEGEFDPALVVTTNYTRPGVTLADLEPFLDPANWPSCCELWKQMDLLNPNEEPPCFLEVIGLDSGSFELRTCVTFTRVAQTVGSSLDFRLCVDPAHLQRSDGIVRVDEGWIEAREESGSLRVETSKRVMMQPPFDAAALEMYVCILGYGSVGADMMFSCIAPGGNP